MKKIIVVVVALLLVFLNVAPVAAKPKSGVFIRLKGEYTLQLSLAPGYELEDAVGKLTLTMDTRSNTSTMEVKFGKPLLFPYLGPGLPEEQWITGMHSEGTLDGYEIDGSTITLFVGPAQVSLVPSGDLLGPPEPSGELVGTIVGNKVSFDTGDPNFTILVGRIKIK